MTRTAADPPARVCTASDTVPRFGSSDIRVGFEGQSIGLIEKENQVVTVEVHQFSAFTGRETDALAALRSTVDFGVPPYTWALPTDRPTRILLWKNRELIAHSGVLERTIRVGDHEHHVAGIYSVMARPDARGLGYGSTVVRRAAEVAEATMPTARHIVLVCLESRVNFYARLGWNRVEAPVRFDQPDGPHLMEIVTMARPVGASAWPSGDVDLCGLPW